MDSIIRPAAITQIDNKLSGLELKSDSGVTSSGTAPKKTDFMIWCIAKGMIDEAKLDLVLSTPQTKHTEGRKN